MSETVKDPGREPVDEPDELAEDFLGRWSQRKSEAGRQAPSTQAVESPEPEPPVLTDEDMPSLDSLGQDSDYSGFLSPGVSESLRQLALRKLFSGAKFNITDGLDDYAEDYSKWVPLGDVITYDMQQAMDKAKEKLERMLTQAGESPADGVAATAGAQHDSTASSPELQNNIAMTENPDEPGKP